MKKFFITTLIAASIFTSSFAADANKVNHVTKQNFHAQFDNVTDVNWTVTANYTKANFVMEGEQVQAFFDAAGGLIATSRAINLDQLPTDAKRSFAKKYAAYNVSEAIKFEDTEGTAYYISAENEKEKIVIKISRGIISNFKKTDK